MYLLISDKYALINNRSFYSISGDWLAEVAKCFPDYSAVTADNIEEILIYSNQSGDDDKRVKLSGCAAFASGESFLRVDYDNPQEIELTSGEVRKRRYGFCKRNNLLSENGFPPSVIFINDIREYKRIKSGKTQFVINENLLSQLTDMVANNDWVGILRCFPKMDQIENDALWNDPECLGKLTFALSKLAARTYKNPRPEDIQRKKDNEAYFLKVSERCIELEPYRSMHKSTLAYFLYDRYKKDSRQEDFERAKELFEDLMESSQTKFKEQYRYANLLRTHYGLPDTRYDAESYKEFGKIIAEYESLLASYQNLSEEEKAAQRKNYIKAMYQYVWLHAERTFKKRYWDAYFNREFTGIPVKEYLINDAAIRLLDDCEDKIDTVLSMIPSVVNANNINDKPSFFDAQYRKAQILQSRGFVALLTGKEPDEYLPLFCDSAGIIDNLLKTAKQLRSQGIRFMFPDYLKVPQAVNYCILHKEDQIENLFFKAKPWMMYEYGKICVLLGNHGQALDILNGIPERDLCRTKAEKLIEALEGNR